MHCVSRILFSLLVIAIAILTQPISIEAQVTTATLYGIVRDSTGAVLPGVDVTATSQGTNLSRNTVTDERGEFALPALPAGAYMLQIQLSGFKTYTNRGMELRANQVVRQTYVLEVGEVAENVTVTETAPLVETASSAQRRSLGTLEATQLPLARRNVSDLLSLTPGVIVDAGFRTPRLNGVGMGGTGITVDGTDAVGGPENRSMGGHGAFTTGGGGAAAPNQIDVMSIEAVAEVQIIKGILPAEYGGVTGGQVNLITRSGTNAFHGSLLENYQGEEFFAQDPFLRARGTPKPSVRFNQFGGSYGGPIVRDRAFFFTTYEGYREKGGVSLLGTVPTKELRERILAALPFPETKMALDPLPLPNEPINADIGRYRATGNYTREDNHVLVKGDVRVFNGNLSLSFTRGRPNSALTRVGNGSRVPQKIDRINTQHVLAGRAWVSESRFGWNRTIFPRFDDFWSVSDPSRPPANDIADVDRRVPSFTVPGLFETPGSEYLDLKGRTLNIDQKFSRVTGTHNVKVGFRWLRQGGGKTNPNNPTFSYQTVADLLANTPNSVFLEYGKPLHDGHLDEYGAFVQDDWRINNKLVLNLGLRYDSYSTIKIRPTGNVPAQIVNLNRPSDLRKLDFGEFRDPDKPYDPDRINFGPRLGFAWTLDDNGTTTVRGGSGLLFSSHLYAMLQNNVSDPFGPADVLWNRTEAASRGLRWPMYSDELRDVSLRDAGGEKLVYAIIDTALPNPYTIQTMINVQRSFGATWMAEAGYLRTDGRNFPLHRPFTQAFDRATGTRPNLQIGNLSAHHVSSEQTMVYNALQTSVRKRFSDSFGFDLNYALSKGWADQGGALTSVFVNPGGINTTQDFWEPEIDRHPLNSEARHRVSANAIYELPELSNGNRVLSQLLGGWQISSILSISSGLPLRITQPSGIRNSRPDYVGGNPVLPDWGETLLYLNKAAFAPVPTHPATRATIRPGTANPDHARGPGRWTVNMSLQKTFRFKESVGLAIRADAFNALNHVTYNDPNTNINSPDFGRITSAGRARTGQVGIRVTF